jgi:hypothetical protein
MFKEQSGVIALPISRDLEMIVSVSLGIAVE